MPRVVRVQLEAAVDLDDLAERVAELLGGRREYYDQATSPLGRRRHLEAARRGAFPSYKEGNRVLAKRADVDAYIRANPVTPKAPRERPKASAPPTPLDPQNARLDAILRQKLVFAPQKVAAGGRRGGG